MAQLLALQTALIWTMICILENANSLPLNAEFMQKLAIKRMKRGAPTGNVYDPPLPVFPAKENAPFWNPPPYPFPTTTAAPPSPRKKLQYYDPNNPYLDVMTDAAWPNYGLGLAYMTPTLAGGGINWPTGNALMPSDHFNGTIAYARPIQLRVGMQGGPTYPWQNPQFIKTAKDINDANALQQLAQMQSDARLMNSVGSTQGAPPSGFIPVQPQLAQQQPLQQPLQQQQFFPRSQQSQAIPQNGRSMENFPSALFG